MEDASPHNNQNKSTASVNCLRNHLIFYDVFFIEALLDLAGARDSRTAMNFRIPMPVVVAVGAFIFVLFLLAGAIWSGARGSTPAPPPTIGELVLPDPPPRGDKTEDDSAKVVVNALPTIVELSEPRSELAASLDYTPWPDLSAPTRAERELLAAADADCVNPYGRRQTRAGTLDLFTALIMLRIEARLGVPEEARGITVAAWCREASYQHGPTEGDGGHAVGPLQLHPIFEARCGRRLLVPGLTTYAGGRSDPLWSAACFIERIKAKLDDPAVERCPNPFLAAEAWTASWPRYYPSCGPSQHGEILIRWRPAVTIKEEETWK